VSVDELITMVSIALGERDLLDCKSGDGNDNGAIEVDDLVRAVDNALNGCRTTFKTEIQHPAEPYLAFPATEGGPSWVKFTIRVNAPDVVYFQNSGAIPFHHDFVSMSLAPYIGWTPAEIDAVSLHAEGQELVFGAVLYSPSVPQEVAIQLVRQDAYSAADVIKYFEAVRASVKAAPEVPFFYFPTFEHQEAAAGYRQELEDAGIPIGSTARWLRGDACYAFGWARGRLVFVAGDDIADAYAAGDLGPNDILFTDGVPAEIPFVAGVVSLTPSTPSSHVAILAGDWEIPFAFLAQPESVAAQSLIGRESYCEPQRSLREYSRKLRRRLAVSGSTRRRHRFVERRSRHAPARAQASAGSAAPTLRSHRLVLCGGRYGDARRHRHARRQGRQLRPHSARGATNNADGDRIHL
jgi:hypothetical protein